MNEAVDERLQGLLNRAATGDEQAHAELLGLYRARLRQMVQFRMDSRLVQRFDPSDVVQEALLTAAVKLPDYLRERPVAFYPWLRRLAWERLVDLQREHLEAQRRTVQREEQPRGNLSGDSLHQLARYLAGETASPLSGLLREERLTQLRAAIEGLDGVSREVLVLRYLEGLRLQEVAEVMGVSLGAAKMRHLRAIRRLRDLLDLT